MANHTGGFAYPTNPGMAPQMDGGPRTVNWPSGLARGADTTPFNIHARGLMKRQDIPKKPQDW